MTEKNIPFAKPRINIFKKSESKNNNLELINQVKNLNEENFQLKEALIDLEKDLKEKDKSIEESQNIINKLKNEYTKLVKEFELMEKSYNELLEDFNKKTLEIYETKKNQSLNNVLINKSSISDEKKYLQKQNISKRKKILSCGSIDFKDKTNLKNNNEIIQNLRKSNMTFISIIKDKEIIIKELNKKLNEMNEALNKKNENIIIIKDEYDINKINKGTSFNSNNNNFNNNKLEDYKSDIINNINTNNNDILEDFWYKNISISIKELSQENSNFPNKINLKTELIITELFSSLIREYNFTNFLQKLLNKLNLTDKGGIKNIIKFIFDCKNRYVKIIKENHKLKKLNNFLLKKNNKYIKYIKSINESVKVNNEKMKNKCDKLIDIFNSNLNENNIEKFEKVEKKSEFKNKNILRNRIIKIDKNLNLDKTELNKFKIETLNSQRNLGSVSSLEEIITKRDKFNRTFQNLLNRNSIMNNNSINMSLNDKKKSYIKDNNYENDIINFTNTNSSLEYFPIKTEVNTSHDNSLFKKIKVKKGSQISLKPKNNKIKKDIFKLNKEFNNTISKSITRENVYDSIDEIKLNSPRYIKINKRENSNFNEFMAKTIQRNEKINYLKTEFINNSNTSREIAKNLNNEKFGLKPKNIFFTSDYFLNMLFRINEGIFVNNEINKFKQMYNLSSYENIYLIFKKNCNELKNLVDEMNLKINKCHYLSNSNIVNIQNNEKQGNNFLNGSFKSVNDKIINLKKLEFEFINMNEYLKNYLIAQETTIQLMNNSSKKSFIFEPIEKLFNLLEDCLTYRINEMTENIIFNRKLIIKLFKNQINCLFLSFEYKS